MLKVGCCFPFIKVCGYAPGFHR